MEAAEPASTAADLVAKLATTRSDPSGFRTFGRYRWQAKQAARLWLACLAPDGPAFLVCEHGEDIVLIYHGKIRFLQLKTRDHGSWSVADMAASGLDSLVRAYFAALEKKIADVSEFELWLEGPVSDAGETLAFEKDPRSATKAVRAKLQAHGRKWHHGMQASGSLDDFLTKLTIHGGQPPSTLIDDRIVREIGTLWPNMSLPECQYVYRKLLEATSAAQAAEPDLKALREISTLWLTRPELDLGVRKKLPVELAAIQSQVLDYESLVALTPPLPGEPVEALLRRIAAGEPTSALELKQRTAGATESTVARTKELRAGMEFERQLLVASRTDADAELERLAVRVLTVASYLAESIHMSAAANPGPAAKPAEAIAAALLSDPSRLAATDDHRLFGADGLTLYGYLAHLSDMCRFPWRHV